MMSPKSSSESAAESASGSASGGAPGDLRETGAQRSFKRTLTQWFHRSGSPRWFFGIADRFAPWFAAAAIGLLSVGMVWGLLIAPPDYLQGNMVRVIYLHVPAAILCQSIYVMMAASAAVLLIWRIKLADWTIAVAAPMGAWMTALALFTGGIWGKPTWGTFWVWDGRTTATLMQLFLYLGVIALRSSIAGEERAGRAAALLCLIGLPNIFVIKYSVTWWLSMHQVSTFKLTSAPSMPPEMYAPLLVNVLGFYCLFTAALLFALRLEVLRRERRTQWVRDWLQTGVLPLTRVRLGPESER